ncbi:MAG: glycosyltransferase [Opitutaceae bacterium]|nr:glycosyltransferase [Opitutaceae bacterium]
MKILIVQDYLRSGGTERQSVLLANAFAAAGHTVTLLTFRPGGRLAATVAAGVERCCLQPFDLGLDWFAPRLVARVRAAAPEVVLCMGRMANCYAGRLQTALPRTAVIATMRTGKRLPARFRASLHAVRHIVANSHDARDTLVREHTVPREKISVIHNSLVFPPLPAGEAAPSPRLSLRGAHGAGPATTVLLCVAMFRPEKNQRELIEIVAGLPAAPDWQLWLAGDGPARAACEQLVAQKQLAARVKFLGFHRDPAPLYRAADLAVHASWSEALSNFLIEAQAHGLPAVAYEAQGIAECFVPGRTGWTIPRDERAAFRAALVQRIGEPPAEREARAAEARAYARTTFDPTRQVAAYLELFSHLLSLR